MAPLLKSDVIADFLKRNTFPDLSRLYYKGMEVQVNVAQDNGVREDTGKPTPKFRDPVTHEVWKSFRIPHKAMSEPEDNDGPIKFNLDPHVEGIGMTGWDWQERKSLWVAYDFDAMFGHSDKHQNKLTEAELAQVRDIVVNLPFVTLRKSTSGRGLHYYIFLEGVRTENHNQHAALARAILSHISGITGFNFAEKVDICGGNMWVWHRKMAGTSGLELIREGTIFPSSKIPQNWMEHEGVITRKSTRVLPKMEGVTTNEFLEMSGCRAKVPLDEGHLRLTNWLSEHGYPGWWDTDNHMLTTHTYYLKLYAEDPNNQVRGSYDTMSTGREAGGDINCYAFPMRDGAWAIRRYGRGTKEAKIWVQDGKGWTRTFFNRELTLADVARLYDAVETANGGYQFQTCSKGMEALEKLGIKFELPGWILERPLKVKESRQDHKINAYIPQHTSNEGAVDGWIVERKVYHRVLVNPAKGSTEDSVTIGDFDDKVRHLVDENGEDHGWAINTDEGNWRFEPLAHVRTLLASRGIGKKDSDMILGQAINRAWKIVNKPFEPEYPGDREWNRSKAKLQVVPSPDGDNLSFPTWQKVLDHCGKGLDFAIQNHPWCQANGIGTGGQYLKLWIAALFKFPKQPLPYLAFYGPQDSGKSTFHESICQLLLDGGYMDGEIALTSQSKFNGELQDSILCTLEEVDLRNKMVYQRLKDWVTSHQISMHIKGATPYKVTNYTHWVQCCNDRDFIPAFSGDSRITMCYVDSLPDSAKIPKRDLWVMLKKEAPDFLASILACEIPDSRDRLMVPVISTSDKLAATYESMNPVEQWFSTEVHRVDGEIIKFEEALNAFHQWAGMETAAQWGKIKFSKAIPQDVPKGRVAKAPDQSVYLGNVSMRKPQPGDPKKLKWMAGGVYMAQPKLTTSVSSVGTEVVSS